MQMYLSLRLTDALPQEETRDRMMACPKEVNLFLTANRFYGKT